MRHGILRTATLSFMLVVVVASAQSGSKLADRHRVLMGELAVSTQKLEQRVATTHQGVELRDATNGALAEALLGRTAQSEMLLRVAFERQNMDAGKDLGALPWTLGDDNVHDANSIDFGSEAIGPLLLGHGTTFSPEFIAWLRPHVAASLTALERHDVAVSYTNIYVMNTTARLLLSKWLGDESAHTRAVARLQAWLEYTHSNGIHEFDSPTYGAVAFSSLYAGCGRASEEAERAMYRDALSWFWTDYAASFFPAANKIAGAHSRDYDFLYGRGSSEIDFFLLGLAAEAPKSIDLEKSLMLDSALAPSCQTDILPWGNRDRVVTQRWDANPDRTRTTYITPRFAIGSANGDYGPQDKMFAFDFASPQPKLLPTVSLEITSTGVPYGKDTRLDRSGHAKPTHLPAHLASVQKQGVALLIAAPDESADRSAPAYYADLVLPAAAELTVDGQPAEWKHGAITVGPKTVLTLRHNGACFAVSEHPLSAEHADVSLLRDAAGAEYGALRLSLKAPRKNAELPVAFLVAAGDCDGPMAAQTIVATAAWRSEQALPLWTVSVKTAAGAFEIVYDLTAHTSVRRAVDGATMDAPVFSVRELPSKSKHSE